MEEFSPNQSHSPETKPSLTIDGFKPLFAMTLRDVSRFGHGHARATDALRMLLPDAITNKNTIHHNVIAAQQPPVNATAQQESDYRILLRAFANPFQLQSSGAERPLPQALEDARESADYALLQGLIERDIADLQHPAEVPPDVPTDVVREHILDRKPTGNEYIDAIFLRVRDRYFESPVPEQPAEGRRGWFPRRNSVPQPAAARPDSRKADVLAKVEQLRSRWQNHHPGKAFFLASAAKNT